MSTTSGYLPNMLGPVVLQADGVDQTPAAVVNFVGATGEINSTTGALDITTEGGGGGGSFTAGGDLTGTSSSQTVAKVHGATVPASGSLTTGNAPYVSGVSALTYSALNLAGGSGWVTGTLPAANGGLGASASAYTGLLKFAAGVSSAATLVNADVSSSAAIAVSKLAPGTNTYVLTTTGGVAVWAVPPIIFDDATPADRATIRSGVTHPATIDNTKHGIVSLGAGLVDGDSPGDVPYQGTTAAYATCVGGAYPSITGAYSGGGGYRPNSRGMGAWAFGYSAFADGEACFSAGRSNVSGAVAGAMTGNPNLTFASSTLTLTRAAGDWTTDQFVAGSEVTITGSLANNFTAKVITVTTTVLTFIGGTTVTNEGPSPGITVVAAEKMYATTFGRQCQAKGDGSFAAGKSHTLDLNASYATAFGLNCNAGPAASYAFAAGNQCEVRGNGCIAIGISCIAGAGSLAGGSDADGSVALGYVASATGSAAIAIGNHAVADHAGGIALGTLASSTATNGTAIGKQASAENDYSSAIGYGVRTTGVCSTAIGQGTIASRYSEFAHGGFPAASGPAGVFKRNLLLVTSSNASVENMQTPASAELSVDDTKTYLARVFILGSRTDAAGKGAAVHTLLMHATGGTLTIDSDTTDAAPALAAGWTVAISAPGGLVMRIAANGAAGQTVKFSARVEWTELEGF